MIRVAELIERKRDGGELSAEELAELMLGYAKGEIPDYQLAAFCMAVFFRGLSAAETYALTDALIRTGETVEYLLPRLTNIRRANVDDSANVPQAWRDRLHDLIDRAIGFAREVTSRTDNEAESRRATSRPPRRMTRASSLMPRSRSGTW